MTEVNRTLGKNHIQSHTTRRHGIFLVLMESVIAAFVVVFLLNYVSSPFIFIAVLSIIALALFAWLLQQNWLVPGAFFALVWSFYITIPLIAAPHYRVPFAGTLWLALAVFAVYVGSLAGTKRASFRHAKTSLKGTIPYPEKLQIKGISPHNIRFLVIVLTILGFGATFVLLRSSGREVSTFMAVDSLVEMGHEFSVARYKHAYVPPLTARFFSGCTYLAIFLGGLLFPLSRSLRSRLIAIAPFLPAISTALVLTTKASVLFAGVLWIGTYLSVTVLLDRGKVRLFTMPRLLAVLMSVLLVTIASFTLQLSRQGTGTLSALPQAYSRLRRTFFGYVACFSQWFEQSSQEIGTPHFGAYSFKRLFVVLGLHTHTDNIYHEATTLAPGESSTVYTVFRGLIEDFTLIGVMPVLFLFGFVAGLAFKKISTGNTRYLPILVAFYCFALWSHVVSVFNYNSIIVAFCAFSIYWLVTTRKQFVLPRSTP